MGLSLVPDGCHSKKCILNKKIDHILHSAMTSRQGITEIMCARPLAIILGTPQPSGITIHNKRGRVKTLILTCF
jgi:hypothetical protein